MVQITSLLASGDKRHRISPNEKKVGKLKKAHDLWRSSGKLTRCVENFLIVEIVLGVRVQVPSEYWAIEPWCDEKLIALAVLDVLHPIRMSTECPDFAFKVSGVVDRNCRIIWASCKEPIVEKPFDKNRKVCYNVGASLITWLKGMHKQVRCKANAGTLITQFSHKLL